MQPDVHAAVEPCTLEKHLRRAHGADPVPFVLYDSRVSEGSGLPYSEANGAKGPYVDDGAQLMDLLFELKKL